jgi:predicted solute-binding protein
VWALRRGHHDDALRDKLRTAKSNGLAHLAQTIETYPDYDANFRQTYLGGHIQYELGDAEKAGLVKFSELLETHGEMEIFTPLFV